MKISFKNLGVIKQLDLDLSKKLIVFCGPNGTGKTYACYAMYGFLKTNYFNSHWFFSMDELIAKKNLVIDIDYDKLYSLKKEYGRVLDINGVFGLLQDNHFSDFKVEMQGSMNDFMNKIHSLEFSFEYKIPPSVILRKKKDSDSIEIILNKNDVDGIPRDDFNQIILSTLIGKYLCFYSSVNTYILPVERSSAYTFANELAKNRFTSDKNNNRYPSPISDTLATAVDLNFVKKKESKYKWLAEEIEKDILHGNMFISEDGELQFRPENATNVSLPFQLSASFIKNLSGLLIYLKYQAKENELLIIDEPELGLHPDNQILLARIFARLINNGIRILISTHSDYIIRELNNLIMLSADNETIRQNASTWGYKPDEKIKPEDVGAYLFNFDKQNQVKVESLPVDDSGFEVTSIDKAIGQLNEKTEEIFYALKYSNKEDEPIG